MDKDYKITRRKKCIIVKNRYGRNVIKRAGEIYYEVMKFDYGYRIWREYRFNTLQEAKNYVSL